ncbi:MAG: copper homeostasis protein CutC [Bacteroidota bacterium]
MIGIEVCIETFEEAKIAASADCNRIEICSALALGGLTPSIGLIESCLKLKNIESHILIRPRAGNFMYTKSELEIMKNDIARAADLGVKGVVFGCLDTANEIDSLACELLIKIAKSKNLEITFHRAIDFTTDFLASFKKISSIGFDRILTSGKELSAEMGLLNIKKLISENKSSIEIMAGGGINPENIHHFLGVGLDAVHFSLKSKADSISKSGMGNYDLPDAQKMIALQKKIRNYENNQHP